MITPPSARFTHEAMATTFEIWIAGQEQEYARQAAAAAFAEIDRLESKLSRFIVNSEIAAINRLAGREAVPLSAEVFECVRIGQRISVETGGCFDMTIGALLDCQRPIGLSKRQPPAEELTGALARTGHGLLELDEERLTARLQIAGAGLDLGAIGKGYAVDQAAAILKDWDIPNALIAGGGSSVLALRSPEGYPGWPVGVGAGAGPDENQAADRMIMICDQALGGSGTAVKGRHILDPRTGRPPATATVRTWVLNPSAAVADALSTAFMVMNPAEIESFCQRFADVGAMLLIENGGRHALSCFGFWPA